MAKIYKAICHTKCFWLETLWQIGEVYEGVFEPNKHFSADGKLDSDLPPPDSGSDKRSNNEIRKILKNKYGSSKPMSWPRKKLWAALHEFENAEGQDELTNPNPGRKPNITADMAKKAK